MFNVSELTRPGLRPVSFRLNAGELVCLSGPSGAGKTLLLRALADLDVNQGSVSLHGVLRESLPPQQWRRRVALLPAESRWWEATVAEHFTVLDSQQLRQLGFDQDVADWRVERLSTGEKQRLALLRLLANRPEVLLLDEPTANLDATGTLRVEQLVKDYLQATRASCLWVSHDRQQIERLCDRCFEMATTGLREVA
jgi:ABC-type multidrug transport system ATPase subunit